ncbi:hypothetical protein AVEN_96242-1 [Araneus ventricosus]|uniref:Uncharacterized protein n=1 Tax=Araneus ventricosus TaxID=182803 RepID=A0A4Y2MCH3_ARAVE|nr:hypothetical protein AVEN_96242-1 [Araneus ventricosus]
MRRKGKEEAVSSRCPIEIPIAYCHFGINEFTMNDICSIQRVRFFFGIAGLTATETSMQALPKYFDGYVYSFFYMM